MTEIPARWDEYIPMPRVRDLTFSVRVGDLVVLRSRGERRLARVTKVGRERLETEFTTASAIQEAARGAYGGRPLVTRKPVRMDDDWLRYAGRPS